MEGEETFAVNDWIHAYPRGRFGKRKKKKKIETCTKV